MAKVIFEFNDAEEKHDINLIVNRHRLASMLYEVQNYARNLYKYEERNEIPAEEISNKLQEIINDWYTIQDL